jgi:uncharacterized membrane protein SpoIIM required for sporulation
MVLESIIGLKKAELRPWNMFFLGLIYASVAVLLSVWIFKSYLSLNVVFLTTLASLPLMIKAIKEEERNDLNLVDERSRLRSHSKVLAFFMFLFVGITVGFSMWYVFLPEEMAVDVFGVQMETIENVDEISVSGNAVSPSAALPHIFKKNLKLLFICLIFSFFYGAGAIYILTLNASFIGTAMGIFVKSNFTGNYFGAYSLALLRYLTHGIPEILSFFMAGLAGGIISIAVIRHDYKSKHFERVVFDSVGLVVLAVFYLFLAALIEYVPVVAPAVFHVTV